MKERFVKACRRGVKAKAVKSKVIVLVEKGGWVYEINEDGK